MNSLLQYLFDHFWWFWFGCLIWVLGNFTYKHYRNKKKGLYFTDPTPEDIIYQESKASGNSQKSFRTKFGGASNCLKLMITTKELYIRPVFPFIILGPYFDMIHTIPLERIRKVEKKSGFMHSGLNIEFEDEEEKLRSITIVSKKESDLRNHLHVAIEQNIQQVGLGNSEKAPPPLPS